MTVVEQKIRNFTDSLQKLVSSESYYAALTVALTLPDICTKLEKPEEYNTGKRYIDWFNSYMASEYQKHIGPDRELCVFLSGDDFYALRCSFLHQGETNIEEQKARKVLKNFVFVKPLPMMQVHRNKINDTLQLQVDVFCVDVLLAVEKWLVDHKESMEINERAKNLIDIKEVYKISF